MKKQLTLIILSAVLLITTSKAQPCSQNDFTFTSQAQIDAFPIDYPDCDSILGTLTIRGDDITNLDSLEGITFIGGDLWIGATGIGGIGNILYENDNLVNLIGLDSLHTVEGNLLILGNRILQNLNGLNNLVNIGASIEISRNDSLTSLSPLSGIKSIPGDLELGRFAGLGQFPRGNGLLVNLDGLDSLSSIGGSLRIIGNTSLTDVSQLHNIDSIPEVLYLGVCPLTTLAGLENITTVGSVTISSMPSLTNLDGLTMTEIPGNLHIVNCPLTTLSDLENINSIGFLKIEAIQTLTNLDGLDNLTSLSSLSIIYNNNLFDLSALSNITNLSGSLIISGNESLQNLEDLINLTSVNTVYIYGNHSLTSLTGLENIDSIPGNLNIGIYGALDSPTAGNNSLTDLTGLNSLTSVGTLVIVANQNLTSLNGLEQLNSITGSLFIGGSIGPSISGNKILTDLSALENLNLIGGELVITGNNELTSLCGLGNIEPISITSSVSIKDNPNLSECHVSTICEYLNGGGSYMISGNSNGCNDFSQIDSSCVVSLVCETTPVEEILENDDIKIFPNPTNGMVNITGFKGGQIQVLNSLGKVLMKKEVNFSDIDLSELPKGMYFIHIESGNQHISKRIIKL